MEPARGETVAENFQLYLEEQDSRQEQAQRQEVLVEDETPTQQEEPTAVEESTPETPAQQSQSSQPSMRSIAAGPATLPFYAARRDDVQSPVVGPRVDNQQTPLPFVDQPGLGALNQSLDQTTDATSNQAERTRQVEEQTQPVEDAQFSAQGAAVGSPLAYQYPTINVNRPQSPPGQQPPWSTPRGPDLSPDNRGGQLLLLDEPGQRGNSGGTGSGDLAPGFLRETYATAATRGRVNDPVPSTAVLAERPAIERATGALPTGLELYGSDEEQAQFETVADLFSFSDSGGFGS